MTATVSDSIWTHVRFASSSWLSVLSFQYWHSSQNVCSLHGVGDMAKIGSSRVRPLKQVL